MIHEADLARLTRRHYEREAIRAQRTAANDDNPPWHTTAQTIALLLIGSAIVGLTLFAWIAS